MIYFGVSLFFVRPPRQTYNVKSDAAENISAGVLGPLLKHGPYEMNYINNSFLCVFLCCNMRCSP